MTDNSEPKKFHTHRFRIGNFTCIAIDDGGLVYAPPTFPRPAEFLFSNAPAEELDVALKKHGLARDTWDEWPSPYTCLLIDTGTELVLVDTGAGSFTPDTGKLVDALATEGFFPPDVTVVIITHGHCDHINGCANEKGEPQFPNARYVISTAEHEFWTSSKSEKALNEDLGGLLIPIARKNLDAVKDHLELIDSATEVVHGVTARPAYGHTPGHITVEVNGGAGIGNIERLVVLGDSILHPIHCECPHFSAAVDVVPQEATKTRQDLLQKITEEGCLVHGYHFPFPGVGFIETSEKGFVFRTHMETPPQ